MNRFNRLTIALLLFALPPAGAQAQATLMRDINPLPPAAGSRETGPRQFAAAGGRAVFVTSEGEPDSHRPYLLWATDGSAAGTSALLQLCSTCWYEPQRVAELPGLAIYQVTDEQGESRLWRTDGTRAGTFPVSPPLSRIDPESTAVLDQRLIFYTCGQHSACGLWSTAGSAAGSTFLRALFAAPPLVRAGGRVFFSRLGGPEEGLWATDGTAAGTKRVRAFGFLSRLTASGSRLFFLCNGDSYPEELWTSDGTRQGTRFLRRFNQPNEHYQAPYTDYLKPVPGGIVLVGISSRTYAINLWKSDGTPEGTRQLTSFPSTDLGSLGGLLESQIAAAGNRTLFVVSSITGPRLWSTQGSPATTAPVTGCPGGCPALQPDSPLTAAGGRVLFAARDPGHGTEPWVSDGTGAGTRRLSDLCAGACDSNPRAFTFHNGWIDFQATWSGQTWMVRTDGAAVEPLAPVAPVVDDGATRSDLADVGQQTSFAGFDSQGSQLWMTDGTAAGSRRLVSGEGSGGSDPRDFVMLGDRLLFTASDGATRSVWTVDASGAAEPISGTGVAIDRPGPSSLTVSGGLAYFVSDLGPDGMELWRTDGSPAGTLRLATFPDKALSDLRDLDGRLVLLATSTTGDQPVFSFWGINRRSDGTAAGTVSWLSLPPDTVKISAVTALGPELYFELQSETASGIFRADGTAEGTRMILREDYACGQFARAGGLVYFTACVENRSPLYQTDGTAAGTTRVIPAPGDTSETFSLRSLFEFQGDLYYFGTSEPEEGGPTRTGLWRGRTAATRVFLKAFSSPGYGGPVMPHFTALGDRLYFRAWDSDHGVELWRTDGTAAGTLLVRDLNPGPASGDPQGLVAAGGRLWFSALDPEHGRELWTSDGTRKGTHMAEDLAPGPVSSAPEQLTVFRGRLYCAADDGVRGREPWSLGLPGV